MGVKKNELILLQILREKKGDFGKVLTLGRQKMYFTTFDKKDENRLHTTLDTLLISEFGASLVDSLDYSAYEGANVIQDLTSDIPEHLKAKYDLIIDFGTLEHVFSIETALRNCREMVKNDGWIIHANPSNNSNGHGLFQFSPEFYLSLYSRENGFSNTRVFAVDMSKKGRWYEIISNSQGKRINLISRNETYVFCVTQLQERVENIKVFQSDYVSMWSSSDLSQQKEIKRTAVMWYLKRMLIRLPFVFALREEHFRKNGVIHSVPDGSSLRELDVSRIK
jgi:hypothetical protein